MGQARSEAPSLERGLALLDILAKFSWDLGGMTAGELARRSKIPHSSLYRLLNILLKNGYISQDPASNCYRLSSQSLALGYVARSLHPLAKFVQPQLRELTRETRQMSEFVVSVGQWQLLVLETWQSERTPLKVHARPGLQFNLDPGTAHGLCYLAFDGSRQEDFLAVSREPQEFRANVKSLNAAELREQCVRNRKLGYVWERCNAMNNGRILAPVYNPRSSSRRLAGSFGIVYSATEVRAHDAPRLARIVLALAARLEAALA